MKPDFSVIKNRPSGKLIIPHGFPNSDFMTSTLYTVFVLTPSTLVCPSKAGLKVGEFLSDVSGFGTVPFTGTELFVEDVV